MRGAFGLSSMDRGPRNLNYAVIVYRPEKKKKKKNCFQAVTTVTYVTWHLTVYI